MATILRGDARSLPLADESVDLVCTSPPYWALRSYQDGGETYDGQIGAEATPAAYVDALIECTREWMRVLKPSGSIFVNLGDVYSRGQRFDSDFTAHDAAWLAGVIDSDGSISIRVDNKGRSHVAWTRVGQMRREVVERIGAVTGIGQVFQDKRGVWNWNAAAQQARWVLERIWPWLQIKRRQALAAIDLMTQKADGRHKGRWNPLSDDDIRCRELIRQAVLAWNRGDEFEDYDPPVIGLPKLPTDPLFIPAKSLMLLPGRYALRCVDDLGLILRAEVIWNKANGLPESVTDRVRRSHEQWFHLVKEPRYYSAVDEIREPHKKASYGRQSSGRAFSQIKNGDRNDNRSHRDGNPLGGLPGSVWSIASQPLKVPASLGIDHFAAFPMEWPKRLILGWSPSGICTECGEGRRPVVSKPSPLGCVPESGRARTFDSSTGRDPTASRLGLSGSSRQKWDAANPPTLLGYACACPEPTAPTRPAVVLDPFGGTGTTALVASVLGRHGISVDASADYCRLAEWRAQDPGERARVIGAHKPKPEAEGQTALFDMEDAA